MFSGMPGMTQTGFKNENQTDIPTRKQRLNLIIFMSKGGDFK